MATMLRGADPQVIELLRGGSVGVMATDTVYGLVCRAADPQACGRLYAIKARETKPGTLLAASTGQLVELGLKSRYLKAVADYWPNPLSIVIPCGPELAYLHRGLNSLACRIPDDQGLRDLLEQTGPLLTTSANTPGDEPAADLDQARQYFGETVDFYADGGSLAGRQASTVIRVVDDAVEVLRPGVIDFDENGCIINN